jgi:hypothetical protein
MAKSKVTITLDRAKAEKAAALVGGRSVSEVIDVALERLIHAEQIRHDVAAYGMTPPSVEELAVADLPVQFDLGDEEVDYDALYGQDA